MQNRFASLLIAALLPLLLFSWFIPLPAGQIDFWLMWLVAMLTVGLPLLYAEIALAHRTQRLPIQGVPALTRQADANQAWRSFVWIMIVLALVIAALSIDAISAHLLTALQSFGIDLNVPTFALAGIIVVVAGLLSLLGSSTLGIATILLLIGLIIGVINHLSMFTLMMTETSLAEWSHAVLLALVSVGVGTGLYWFNSPLVSSDKSNLETHELRGMKVVATKAVLPIWMTQLVIGSVAIFFSVSFGTGSVSPVATIVYTLGVLAASAFLMHYASKQLAMRFNRFGIWIATAISIILTLLMVVFANPPTLVIVLKAFSLLGAFILTIFVGWQMKVSHMRKSLNFKSEGRYNIWRITVRIIVPLLIIMAAIGLVLPK